MRRFLLISLLFVLPAAVYAAETDLIELHRASGNSSNKECLSCHQDITKQTSLNKKIKTFHRLHLESRLATPKNCADCHQSIDLREGSAAALRKQVDPALCAGCHSGGVKGAKVLFVK